jgi:hypothetical protein
LEGLQNYTQSLKIEADKKRGPTFQDQQQTYLEKDLHCSRWFYNIFCFIEYGLLSPPMPFPVGACVAHAHAMHRWIDWNRKRESSAANVEIAWRTLVWGIIYRYCLHSSRHCANAALTALTCGPLLHAQGSSLWRVGVAAVLYR